MEHMVAGDVVGIGWIEMTRSWMADSWIHMIDEEMDTGFTLILFQIVIIVLINIILIGGVTRDIYWMRLRKKNHLHLMEK